MTHAKRISQPGPSKVFSKHRPRKPAGRLSSALRMAVLLALFGTWANAQSRTVFPHVPMGGSVEGSIIISNPHLDEMVTGVLSFRDPSGAARRVDLEGFSCRLQQGVNACTRIPIFIAPGGTRVIKGQTRGELSLGSAVLESNLPVSGYYRFRSGDLHLQLSSGPPSESAAFHLETLQNSDVGFVVANSEEEDIWVEVLVVDGQGKVVEAVAPPEMNPLSARANYSRLVSELGLDSVENRSGWSVQLRSRLGGKFIIVAAVVEQSGFSSLPVVTDLRERDFPWNPRQEGQ